MAWVRTVTGMVLAVVCLPLLLFLPEAGVPLLLVALGMMAARFAWAARAREWIERKWGQVLDWLARQPRAVRWLLLGLLIVVAVVLLVWLGYEIAGG